MRNSSHRSIIINITVFLFIVLCASAVFAEQSAEDVAGNAGVLESNPVPEAKKGTLLFKEPTAGEFSVEEEKDLSALQLQARMYRGQGLEFQRLGNLDEAMVFYQKAVQLDPAYAVAYNDLGIICETRGFMDRAEDCYLQAIKVKPNYLSAYTNLALLYENKRDLNSAAIYWQKRAELGSPDDPWTKKAKQRVEDIGMVTSGRFQQDLKEQEVVALLKETQVQKDLFNKDEKALALRHFELAKQHYEKHEYANAIKEAFNALQLDPANQDIVNFVEKVQIRALSK